MRYLSTLRGDLSVSYLQELLAQADSYDRIAGYFRSSVLEFSGDLLERIPGRVRILCNHEMDPGDVRISRLSRDLRRELGNTENDDFPLETLCRYRRLHSLLQSGHVEIRVMVGPRLLHCKTAIVRLRCGGTRVLNGSLNETRSAWVDNHEIMTEDARPESAADMEALFEEYWAVSIPLPQVVIEEMLRLGNRQEFTTTTHWKEEVEAAKDSRTQESLAACALVETPLFAEEQGLLPWQKGFVSLFLQRRAHSGAARLLLADEVGLGKTMSLGACAMLSILMGDGPVLIVVPAALMGQWQQELLLKFSLRAMAWSSGKARWMDVDGNPGSSEFLECPCAVGIVSTGLVVQNTMQVAMMHRQKWGMVIVDEAHKARSGDTVMPSPNRMMRFVRSIAKRTRHLLLASATPMQLRFSELHELVGALECEGADVLGGSTSSWHDRQSAGKWLSGEWPTNPETLFHLIDAPRLPECPVQDVLDRAVRTLDGRAIMSSMSSGDIQRLCSEGAAVLSKANPFLHHIIMRRRVDVARLIDSRTGNAWLEDIKVVPHPAPGMCQAGNVILDASTGAVEMGTELSDVYDAARLFTKARIRGRGFLATLLLRRMGSSPIAGRKTMEAILSGRKEQEEDDFLETCKTVDGMTLECLEHADWALERLREMGDADPKAEVLLYYLRDMGWKNLGSIVFSQFLDTAHTVAHRLSLEFPLERIGLYAGGKGSRMFIRGQSEPVLQDDIRSEVSLGRLRLLVATDAACEGLNLQAMGTLVNYDMPWNPSKLEQRLGRIRRIGQERKVVHLLNLRYARSVEDRVFELLGLRTKGIFDVLGQIPESLMDSDWIEALLDERGHPEHLLEIHEHKRHALLKQAEQNPFIKKYGDYAAGMITQGAQDWERQSKVLSPAAISSALSVPWQNWENELSKTGGKP